MRYPLLSTLLHSSDKETIREENSLAFCLNLKIFTICYSRHAMWLRLGRQGPGLHLKCTPPLFSERNGYTKPVMRVGRWRLFLLKCNPDKVAQNLIEVER